ncbi:tRNA (guanosine(46)-N7)-methyltransferase TrmB [Aestuariimicrobium soli]|uniref:tRNA (guanosine(46)-N7)-methyltransferase TrmB n=1 Tax=Aestuariimicrobium soli TaxID=2035834 RepID=UPI003EBF9209
MTEQPDDRPRVHREVVSFVRRSDRMNPSQQKAWARHADDWLVPVATLETETSVAPDQPLDLPALFGRTAPLAVEIGTGTGESLAAMASAHPDWNILAFEVFQPAVASAMNLLGREGITNVRFVMNDAAAGLRHLLGPDSITELWTFFPDPWHKTRHHKRRLVQAEFASLVASRLVPATGDTLGGLWRLATDWDDYAEWLREVLDAEPGLVNVHAADTGWAPRLGLRPITKFEAKGLRAGRIVRDLTYARRP